MEVRRQAAPAMPPPLVVGVESLLEQSRASLAAGRYAEAAQHAADAALQAPLRAEAFYLRGLALVDLGRDDDALVELRKAVYLEPERGFAHFLLAGVLDRLGQPLLAAREYAAAADTLGSQPADATAEELGGRSVRELAQLCRQLEHRLVGGQLQSLHHGLSEEAS